MALLLQVSIFMVDARRRLPSAAAGAMLGASIPPLECGTLVPAMRLRLTVLLLVAGCGPSAGMDEACTREDVVTSGALVMGVDPEECSPCDLKSSYVLITLETTCEAGVEWRGDYRIVDHTTAEDLVTGEQFAFESPFGAPAERLWRVASDEPLEWLGPDVDEIVSDPGDYSFRVELLYGLTAVEFEGSIE